jgi:Ras-related protein Rab-5C
MQNENTKDKSSPKGKANKVVIIGDSNVGKTCLIARYVDEKFGESQPTIGALHRMKTVNGIDLDLWDTAGQERFKSMIPMYYKGAKAIIIAFDVTEAKTFQNAEKWLGEIESNTQGCLIVLVGNKIDLSDQRTVSSEQIKIFCDNKKINFFECSAKNDIGIGELFSHIAEKVKEQVPAKGGVSLDENAPSGNRLCCYN